eukprot:585227-Pyramimonas_sp.AAC.1
MQAKSRLECGSRHSASHIQLKRLHQRHARRAALCLKVGSRSRPCLVLRAALENSTTANYADGGRFLFETGLSLGDGNSLVMHYGFPHMLNGAM